MEALTLAVQMLLVGYFLRPMKMYGLREYHIFSGSTHPGNVKWDRTREQIAILSPIPTSVINRNIDKYGNIYSIKEPSMEVLQRIFPLVPERNYLNYELLFCIEKRITQSNGSIAIWIKGAIKHRVTNEIVLLTGTNIEPEEKNVSSIEHGWYSYKADMTAPPLFWDLLLAVI
jgi:hypothetical protein